MKRSRALETRLLAGLSERPQSIEDLGYRMGGLTTDMLVALKGLKDEGRIYVLAQAKDEHGRKVSLYAVREHKGELRVTPV